MSIPEPRGTDSDEASRGEHAVKLFAIDPVPFSSTRMCDCQDLYRVWLLAKDADERESNNPGKLKIEMDSRKSIRISRNIRQDTGKGLMEPSCNSNRSRKVPVDRIFKLARCLGAKTNHRFSLLSILSFTSSQGIPGDWSLARRSSSCRNAGSTTEKPGMESSNESKSSVAKMIRSASGSESADLRISSWDIDMSTSGDGLQQSTIVAKLEYLQSQFSQIVAKLFADGIQTYSQFPLLRSRKTNTTLERNASPPRIIEHVDILGATVPGEGQQRCVCRHDVGYFAITESLGYAIVVEATNVAPRNKRLDQRRIGVVGVKDLASAFWVSESEGTGLEGSIYAGLESLTSKLIDREWQRDDGAAMKIGRCLIDANWGHSTDVVYQFCRQSKHAAVLMPSHGRFVGASSMPFSEYKRRPGERVGLNWRIPNVHGKRAIRHVTESYRADTLTMIGGEVPDVVVQIKRSKATVVFLGDYIDRG